MTLYQIRPLEWEKLSRTRYVAYSDVLDRIFVGRIPPECDGAGKWWFSDDPEDRKFVSARKAKVAAEELYQSRLLPALEPKEPQ